MMKLTEICCWHFMLFTLILPGCNNGKVVPVSGELMSETAVWIGDCDRPLYEPPLLQPLSINGVYRIRHALDEAFTSRQNQWPLEPHVDVYVVPISFSTLRIIVITTPQYTTEQRFFFEGELLRLAQSLYEQELGLVQ